MFVKYNPKDPHVKIIPIIGQSGDKKAVPLTVDSVIIRPGTNELTEEQWAAIQPHVKDEISHEVIVPFTVKKKDGGGVTKARTLKDVPVSVARKIIESCQNVEDLKKWCKQELPDEIMLLVLKRLRKFKIDPDEFIDDISKEDTLDEDITPEDTPEIEEANTVTPQAKNDRSTKRGKKPEETGNDSEDDDEIPDFDGSGGNKE